MAAFDYVYFDINGKRKKGSKEATDKDKLIAILKAEDKMPIKVTEQSMLTKDISFEIGHAVKSRDLAVFCRQFHSILTAGVAVIGALDMLGNETENKTLQKATKDTQKAVEKGESLTQAMSAHKNVFPPILIHMMEAGEISGSYDVSLQRVAEQFEKEAKLKAIIKKATIYPIVLCVVSVFVILVMLTKVIPSFMAMFEDMEIDMPVITMSVVKMSDFAVKYWFFILAMVLLIILGIKIFKASDKGKNFFAILILKVPLIGKLVIKSASARFGRTLSTLLAAGVSITQALEITAKSMDNEIIRQAVNDTKAEVERGVLIADSLEASNTFPTMVSHLVRIGEQSGTTESMLEKVAQYYEEDVENTTASIMTILEPLMIVILAVIIGFLLMAMFQPMLTMYQGMRKL